MSPLALLCLSLLTAAPGAKDAPDAKGGRPAPEAAVEARGVARVEAVLEDWHRAAAQADEARYFAHFTPDAVFLGTDGSERWTRDEFRAWARPFFTRGKAWSFTATERHVSLSADGAVAWFDERLATPNMGPARGSGVLVLREGAWKLAQYNLSVPIPNALLPEFKARIEADAKPGASGDGGKAPAPRKK